MTTDAERNAARDALELQNCCNLTAFVGTMHKHLLAMNGQFGTQSLCDHPATLAFVSKINDLCQFSVEREAEAFREIEAIVNTDDGPQDVGDDYSFSDFQTLPYHESRNGL